MTASIVPPVPVHYFGDSKARGEECEQAIDRVLAPYYLAIVPATPAQQRVGIDRIFTRSDGSQITVEYKCDDQADATGNVFLEVSHFGPRYGANGWVFTTTADQLVYCLRRSGRVFAVTPAGVREALPGWLRDPRFPIRTATNDGYWTAGLCVPIDEFMTIASTELRIEGTS